MGSVPIVRLNEEPKPVAGLEVKPDDTRFIDVDISKYRAILNLFRIKHAKLKNAIQ